MREKLVELGSAIIVISILGIMGWLFYINLP